MDVQAWEVFLWLCLPYTHQVVQVVPSVPECQHLDCLSHPSLLATLQCQKSSLTI